MTTRTKTRVIAIRYRGFVAPFIRFRPIKIGHTRLYTVGPLAIFIHPATHEGHRA
jgi:hypothetical protein